MTTLDLALLPKAELHVHFEATISKDSAAELSDRYGVPMPSTGPFRDLAEFVAGYERARDLVGSLEDLNRLAREFAQRQRAQGVVWTEVHFIPSTYAGRLGDPDDLIAAVLDGLRSGGGGDTVGLVLGINRGLPVAEAERALDVALDWAGAGVVALGLAGDEANFPGRRFEAVFRRAAEAKLPAVPHAGEGAGPRSIEDALDLLSPVRVCHGVRALEDPRVLQRLAADQVCLDMAPSSNVLLGAVSELAAHPLPELARQGVPVTVNSDIPIFVGHDLLREYALCAAAWDLDDRQLLDLAETSIRFSHCPEEIRAHALGHLATLRQTVDLP